MKHPARICVLSGIIACGLAAAAPEPSAADAPKAAALAKPAEKPKTVAKPTLKAGDAAPALSVESWVKGEAVKAFQPGKVYVIEFFATWCLPCKASIPQMTEMQKKHKDLTLICIAGSERTKAGEEDKRLATLKTFVDGQGSQMEYRVGYDSGKTMTSTWMEPAGLKGIPCGFVVGGDGKIAHIGHPLDKEFQNALTDALAKAKGPAAAAAAPAKPPATPAASAPVKSAAPAR